MNKISSQPDQQQKQPKESKNTHLVKKWAKKLRKPKTLFFLIQVGIRGYQVLKWLVGLMDI